MSFLLPPSPTFQIFDHITSSSCCCSSSSSIASSPSAPPPTPPPSLPPPPHPPRLVQGAFQPNCKALTSTAVITVPPPPRRRFRESPQPRPPAREGPLEGGTGARVSEEGAGAASEEGAGAASVAGPIEAVGSQALAACQSGPPSDSIELSATAAGRDVNLAMHRMETETALTRLPPLEGDFTFEIMLSCAGLSDH